MGRIQDWLLFGIQFIIRLGFLGKYELVSTIERTKTNQLGLKALEKTILSLGKKNDSLVKKNETLVNKNKQLMEGDTKWLEKVRQMRKQSDDFLTVVNAEKATFEKSILGLQKKLDNTTSRNLEVESILEQATAMSEQLRGEMKKWRT